MPSADQVPVKTAHSTMHWHLWVVPRASAWGIRMFITKMRTSFPQDLLDYGNSRKVPCGGNHHISPAIAGWVCLRSKEIDHGPASCTGVATLGSVYVPA